MIERLGLLAILLSAAAASSAAEATTWDCGSPGSLPADWPESCTNVLPEDVGPSYCPVDPKYRSQLIITIAPGTDLDAVMQRWNLKWVQGKARPQSSEVETVPLLVPQADGRSGVGNAGVRTVVVNAVDWSKATELMTQRAHTFGVANVAPRFAPLLISPGSEEAVAADERSQAQWHVNAIHAGPALERVHAHALKRELLVGILDTGIDMSHPALRDGAANVPVMDYMNCGESSNRAYLGNHGTHVAGILVGRRPGYGSPLAPFTRFINLPVTYSECVDSFAVHEAVAKLVEDKVDVANLSWSSAFYLSMRTDMQAAKDVLFVAAVGNKRESVDRSPEFPASYNLPNLISVAAFGRDGAAPEVIGRRVDIAAPGQCIFTTIPQPSKYPKGWAIVSPEVTSSSYAAPMVSASALMIKALAPSWRPDQIRRYLIDSADYPWAERGYGKLNADRATAAPVAIQWPRKDNVADSSRGEINVRLRPLFFSDACPQLDVELKLGAGPFETLTAIAATTTDFAIRLPNETFEGLGRLRLSCPNTRIRVESDDFHIKHLCNLQPYVAKVMYTIPSAEARAEPACRSIDANEE